MSAATGEGLGRGAEQHEEPEQRVTSLELFFDLVFVFALTQVTAALAADPTWRGLARGVLVLAALWWTWTGYAWLTNRLASDEGAPRLELFAAMAATLVMALAVPGAFGDEGVAFAVSYLVVRQLHTVMLWRVERDDRMVHVAVVRLAITSAIGPALILVATGFDGAAQGAIWAVALAIDFAGGRLATRGEGGWRVHAGHFAERHALIVIIALGESIVALGAGADELHIGPGVVAAAVLGVALSAALWWAYFDVVALVAERRLAAAEGAERGELARDSYSYLHFPMVAGIVLLAVGVKKTLGDYDAPLKAMPAVCLFGGVALYFAGHVGFRLRNVGSIGPPRTIAVLVLAARHGPRHGDRRAGLPGPRDGRRGGGRHVRGDRLRGRPGPRASRSGVMAHRPAPPLLGRLPEQFFTRILAAAAAARERPGPAVHRPRARQPGPPAAARARSPRCRRPRAETATPAVHGYPPFQGLPSLREAIAARYAADHGVVLDPEREVAVVPGTKTGIMLAVLATAGAGDGVLLPDPGYPDYLSGVALAGARSTPLPLEATAGWQPDLDAVAGAGAALTVLNYPSNPCAVCARRRHVRGRRRLAPTRRGPGCCTTSPTGSWPSTAAAARSVLEVDGARATSRSSCGRRRRSTGWRAGGSASSSATPRWSGACSALLDHLAAGVWVGPAARARGRAARRPGRRGRAPRGVPGAA